MIAGRDDVEAWRGQTWKAVPPAGPDPARPVEYRPVPGFPGYLLGDDRSVWSSHSADKAPPGSWRWIMPDVRGGIAHVVLRRGGRPERVDVGGLMGRLFPAESAPDESAEGDLEGVFLPRENAHDGNPKLDEPKVAEMRRLKSEGWTYPKLAERYGVSRSTVHYALTGVTWRHVIAEDEFEGQGLS